MKKTIKKILSVCLAVAATLCLASCQAKSAYEIAVENGFQGDEGAWLEYLQGTPGKDGKDLDIRDIYEAACEGEDGFKGTFLEFLKEYFGDTALDITEDNNTAQIAQNMLSVVSVQAFSAGSTGSGVIIELDKESGDALILTNYHVVYDPKAVLNNVWQNNIYVYPYGALGPTYKKVGNNYTIDSYGGGLACEYVGGSMGYDIAVLRVKDTAGLKKTNVLPATMGSSDKVNVGEKVFAIGNPKGLGVAVTEGILSLDSEYIDVDMEIGNGIFGSTTTQTVSMEYRVMRTDAAINSGNSGGGLFNTKGELIGIVNAKSVSEDIDNMGYALPITQVEYVVDNILDNSGVVKLARFGVLTQVTGSVSGLDENGNLYLQEQISIDKVGEQQDANGNWQKIDCIANGIFKEGDILKTVQIGEGEAVAINRRYTVSEYLLNVRLGDTVKVVVEREGKQETLSFEFNDAKYFVEK